MSTLEIRTPHVPKSGFGGVRRLVSILVLVVDAFNDALRQAHEAERRYPFTAW